MKLILIISAFFVTFAAQATTPPPSISLSTENSTIVINGQVAETLYSNLAQANGEVGVSAIGKNISCFKHHGEAFCNIGLVQGDKGVITGEITSN